GNGALIGHQDPDQVAGDGGFLDPIMPFVILKGFPERFHQVIGNTALLRRGKFLEIVRKSLRKKIRRKKKKSYQER
ncbi:MAG TPA: hypothetical protein PKV71_01160, partial [Calditrichia bacterium]|nr:hypothetical protein [Calditrichia bacterium]